MCRAFSFLTLLCGRLVVKVLLQSVEIQGQMQSQFSPFLSSTPSVGPSGSFVGYKDSLPNRQNYAAASVTCNRGNFSDIRRMEGSTTLEGPPIPPRRSGPTRAPPVSNIDENYDEDRLVIIESCSPSQSSVSDEYNIETCTPTVIEKSQHNNFSIESSSKMDSLPPPPPPPTDYASQRTIPSSQPPPPPGADYGSQNSTCRDVLQMSTMPQPLPPPADYGSHNSIKQEAMSVHNLPQTLPPPPAPSTPSSRSQDNSSRISSANDAWQQMMSMQRQLAAQNDPGFQNFLASYGSQSFIDAMKTIPQGWPSMSNYGNPAQRNNCGSQNSTCRDVLDMSTMPQPVPPLKDYNTVNQRHVNTMHSVRTNNIPNSRMNFPSQLLSARDVLQMSTMPQPVPPMKDYGSQYSTARDVFATSQWSQRRIMNPPSLSVNSPKYPNEDQLLESLKKAIHMERTTRRALEKRFPY